MNDTKVIRTGVGLNRLVCRQKAAMAFTSASSLRAHTYTISSTPVERLPQIVPLVAHSLCGCKAILAAGSEDIKADGEAIEVRHRFTTTLSSLLQHRTVEGRWSAVVLAKAAIEAGGLEILKCSNGTWVRAFLTILKKRDPPTTRCLTVLTLTRIFMMTWDHANLVREITTPALPSFIAVCLASVGKRPCSAKELKIVLQAFTFLVPKHPAIFRAHEGLIRALIRNMLSSTSNELEMNFYTNQHHHTARRLLVALHHCAPKQTGAERFDETLTGVVKAAHRVCDGLFRSTAESESSPNASLAHAGDENLGLVAWEGSHCGAKSLMHLLKILESHFREATTTVVKLRIGLVTTLLTRLFAMASFRTNRDAIANPQVSKNEREVLLSLLPSVLAAACNLAQMIIARLSLSASPVVDCLLSHAPTILQIGLLDVELRMSLYRFLETGLKLTGPSLTKGDVAELTSTMNACCEDTSGGMKEADAVLSTTQPRDPSHSLSSEHRRANAMDCSTFFTPLCEGASSLLATFIQKIHPGAMPPRLRMQIERVAVLTRNKDILVACTLAPAGNLSARGLKPSLMPLLAREFPQVSEVDALLRPRMPIVSSFKKESRREGDDDEEDDALQHVNGTSSIESNEFNVNVEQQDVHSDPLFDEAFDSTTNGRSAAEIELDQAAEMTVKRAASESPDGPHHPKRPRGSPIECSTAPKIPSTASSIAVVDADTATPILSKHATTQPPEAAGANADDSSDFEIPPLVMESDSDGEDE